MLHIVMDGAGDMPPDWVKLYDIRVIPINIQFGNRTFLQGVELSNEDFYRIVDEKGVIPQTSQPSPQQFVFFYERIAQAGDTILSLHVTSGLSGTFASAQMAARQLTGRIHVIPFDSACGSAALGFMCREARLLQRAGKPVETILERLEFIRRNVSIVLTLNTLEYAHKSGRVKALQAAIASLLDVKPIIVLKDGALDMAERVRTRRKAVERVIQIVHQRVGERLVNVAVVQARDPEAGESLLAQVRGALNCHHLILTDLSISVAANLGPGTVGLAVYPELEG
ncbi:MAG: DegV family protein [Omnitrophica WOR_2 bacterium]